MPTRTLYTFATGTSLPSTVGLPEGYPFVWDHGGGLATLYTLRNGSWFEAAVPPVASMAAASAGLAVVTGDLTTSSPPVPFSDNFNRSNRTLVGDNGWVNSTGTGRGGVADYHVDSNQFTDTGAVGSKADPILHLRNDGAAGVADVTVTHSFGAGSFPNAKIYVVSDLANLNSIAVEFDGSSFFYNIARHKGFDSTDTETYNIYGTINTYNGGWSGWTSPATKTIRVVYTEATKLVEVYQNGTKKLDCSMASANFGGSGDLPALSTMPYCGLTGGSSQSDRFDDIVCA